MATRSGSEASRGVYKTQANSSLDLSLRPLDHHSRNSHKDFTSHIATPPSRLAMSFRASLPLLKNTSRSSLLPKRIQTGLYDSRGIQSGNQVGETFNNKTRRLWLPNVHHKNLWSEALGRKLRLKVTAGALRTIDKVGGLDAYLFRMRPERLGEKGMELRELVRFLAFRSRCFSVSIDALLSRSTGPGRPRRRQGATTSTRQLDRRGSMREKAGTVYIRAGSEGNGEGERDRRTSTTGLA